jgi:uncharacterized protein
MLKGFSAWLGKAAPDDSNADALMSLRLAPDMFPLHAQVRFACFQALEPIYRLRGMAVPEAARAVREEGVKSNQQIGSLADAQARIAQTIEWLSELAPDALDCAANRPIALDLPNGVVFDMTGEQYVRDWVLPQFYFHINTGYSILRHYGVTLGKPDYVAHMFPYLRPGTMQTNVG